MVAAWVVLTLTGLALPAAAAAETFMVDSTADEADQAVGAGGCAAASGECTLRAAIEEADADVEKDEIEFDEEAFDGGAGATIALASGLPPITAPLKVNGHECATALGLNGPCVDVDGPANEAALRVEGGAGVEVAGLAVTRAEVGIEVSGSESFKASRDWFGVSPTGSVDGDGTGVVLGPGSNASKIGTEGLGAGNVFAASGGDGLDVLGAGNVSVLSNYFGVLPDGSTAAANGGADVAVASTPGFEASGTAIGTNLKAAALATPECDRGCNVISGAGTDGVDLSGTAGAGPPVATTIAGNYIGLDAAGTGSVPNTGAGILVGEAAATVVGGPKAGESNYIGGGAAGVRAGPAAPDLVVRGNGIGIGPSGAASAAPLQEGIAVESESLPSVAVEAAIAGNRVRMEGGVGIWQEGFGATIADNSVTGAATGIETIERDLNHGNLIAGNTVDGTTGSGIAVENEFNEIVGNEVSGAGAAAILVDGSHAASGVRGNRVGGDAAGEENTIAASGGAAIEILNREKTETEVARNHGALNGGPFIELVRSSESDAKGPNFGIQPPLFAAATEAGASGSGAEPGALVRVFRKQLPEAGELESFVGVARADGSGSWEVAYAENVPPGAIVAATQTSEAGATSALAIAITGGGGAGGAQGSGSSGPDTGAPPGPAARVKSPDTEIVRGPRRRSRGREARFVFRSDEAGSIFECRLDRGPYRPCRSPRRYRHLRPGRHLFTVRAISPLGRTDPTPAKWRFTVR